MLPSGLVLAANSLLHSTDGNSVDASNVTRIPSTPASLLAVTRRDRAKAEDYARRHGVPRWYDDARALVADPEVKARLGISDGLMRFSVGIEDEADLIADLERGFRAAAEAR